MMTPMALPGLTKGGPPAFVSRLGGKAAEEPEKPQVVPKRVAGPKRSTAMTKIGDEPLPEPVVLPPKPMTNDYSTDKEIADITHPIEDTPVEKEYVPEIPAPKDSSNHQKKLMSSIEDKHDDIGENRAIKTPEMNTGSRLVAALDDSERRASKYEAKAESAEFRFQQVAESNEYLTTQNRLLKERNKQAEAEVEDAFRRLEDANSEIKQLQRRNKLLKEELRQSQLECEKYRIQLQQLVQQEQLIVTEDGPKLLMGPTQSNRPSPPPLGLELGSDVYGRPTANMTRLDRHQSSEFWEFEKLLQAASTFTDDSPRGGRQAKLTLKQLFRVENTVLNRRYDERKKWMQLTALENLRSGTDLIDRQVFYGAPLSAVMKIVENGVLRIGHRLNPGQSNDSGSGQLGDPHFGIHVHSKASACLPYCQRPVRMPRVGDMVKLLALKCCAGRSWRVPGRGPEIRPQPGFDSHASPDEPPQEWFLLDETQCCPTYLLVLEVVEDISKTATRSIFLD
eukprot:TRINITY_DN4230_c0_g1_i1.p1 TRINITY_DN4230_c0_g1~~TRINITY_DN4230_c0_g1_i1.p1  ORF type:complete len:508 (+),score=64.51 TRINITY_DN4230_c0_g1_i1:32-1555(+)